MRFKMAGILEYRKIDYWPMCRLWLLIFHHYNAKYLIDAQIMGQKRGYYSGHRHLEFISCILPTLHYRLQPPYKILRQYLNPWLNYNFLKFKMAAVRRHVGFLKTWLLTYASPWTVDFSITVPNLGGKFDRRPKYGPKSNFKMAPSTILDFRKRDLWPIGLIASHYVRRTVPYGTVLIVNANAVR